MHFMKKLTYFLLFPMLIVGLCVCAQPSNDHCTSALFINTHSHCNSTNTTTTAATPSTRAACVGNPDDDVYFYFTAAQSSHMISVFSGGGTFDPAFEVIPINCTNANLACVDDNLGATPEQVTLSNLMVGSSYYIRVYHSGLGSGTGDFRVCVTDPSNEPPCDPYSAEPANTMVDCGTAVPKICNVNGLCGNTREYHTVGGATSPYTPNSWPELTSAFCGSIENNSFLKFTAGASSLGLRVFGSCSSGSGIQMMVFERLSSSGPPCDNGPINTFGCFNFMNLNPAPANGVSVTFTGMTPGNEYYLMIDGFGGSVCDYKIAADYGVQISVDVTPDNSIICLGSSVNLNAIGGNGSYTWDASPHLDTLVGAGVVAQPNATGDYSFVVNSPSSDPECPSATDTAFVTVINADLPTALDDQQLCLGDTADLVGVLGNALGYAFWSVLPPSGVQPYMVQFLPNHQQTTTRALLPDTGTYHFVLNEQNQVCGILRDTLTVEVQKAEMTLSSTSITCMGANDGEINVNTPNCTLFSFDSTSTYTPNTGLSEAAAGMYYVSGQTDLGCLVEDSIAVIEGPALNIEASGDTLICQNGIAGLHVQVTPAIAPLYRWIGTSFVQEDIQVQPQTDTWFQVQGYNTLGCFTPIDSVFVEVHNPLSLQVEEDLDICEGESVAIGGQVSGGLYPLYSFSWNDGFSHTSFGETEQVVSPTSTTTYVIEASDQCETSPVMDSLTIRVHPNPVPNVVLHEDYICEPAVFELHLENTADETTNVYWDFSSGYQATDTNEVRIPPLIAGTYGLTVDLYSNMGCHGSWTNELLLHSMPTPKANFNPYPANPTVNRPELKLRELAEGALDFEWSMPGAFPSYSLEKNPEIRFPEGVVDDYDIWLKVYSPYDCVDSILKTVHVAPEDLSFIPNSFTPNHDSYNNLWKYEFNGITEEDFSVRVFNRWGEQVFSSSDSNEYWDGTFKGMIVPDGVYIYRIETKSKYTGEDLSFDGQLLILK